MRNLKHAVVELSSCFARCFVEPYKTRMLKGPPGNPSSALETADLDQSKLPDAALEVREDFI